MYATHMCVLLCPHTQLLIAALRDPVTVHFAEVPGVEADNGGMQQHVAQTSQVAFWRDQAVTRRMALQVTQQLVNQMHTQRTGLTETCPNTETT